MIVQYLIKCIILEGGVKVFRLSVEPLTRIWKAFGQILPTITQVGIYEQFLNNPRYFFTVISKILVVWIDINF
jgi:hypothetical protein